VPVVDEPRKHPEPLLELAIRGELSSGERAELGRHLAECNSCAAEVEAAHVFRVATAPGKQDDALNHAAITDALAHPRARRSLSDSLRRWLAPQRLLGPAGALLGAAAMLVIGLAIVHAQRPTPASPPRAALSHPLILRDGSEVTPENETATIQLAEQTPMRTTVLLSSGAAQFRVRHDSKRLFRVDAGPVRIEDIGTVFRVAHETDGRVRVAVSEGHVAVLCGEHRARIELGPGANRVFSATAGAREATAAVNGAPEPPAPAATATEARAESRARSAEDPAELLWAADAARRSHHPQAAVAPLRRLLERYPKDPRAPSAAFTLGWVLLTDLGRPRDAAATFAVAERIAPRGALAEDAAARVAEAWQKAGDSRHAAEAARHYLQAYPSGRYTALMRGLTGDN
jgi:transmembrane sensor